MRDACNERRMQCVSTEIHENHSFYHNITHMKKLISIALAALLPALLSAQTGKVMDNLSMPSKILKMERKYAVYLPPDYETSQRSYPCFTCCTEAVMTRPDGCSSERCCILPMKPLTRERPHP